MKNNANDKIRNERLSSTLKKQKKKKKRNVSHRIFNQLPSHAEVSSNFLQTRNIQGTILGSWDFWWKANVTPASQADLRIGSGIVLRSAQ